MFMYRATCHFGSGNFSCGLDLSQVDLPSLDKGLLESLDRARAVKEMCPWNVVSPVQYVRA